MPEPPPPRLIDETETQPIPAIRPVAEPGAAPAAQPARPAAQLARPAAQLAAARRPARAGRPQPARARCPARRRERGPARHRGGRDIHSDRPAPAGRPARGGSRPGVSPAVQGLFIRHSRHRRRPRGRSAPPERLWRRMCRPPSPAPAAPSPRPRDRAGHGDHLRPGRQRGSRARGVLPVRHVTDLNAAFSHYAGGVSESGTCDQGGRRGTYAFATGPIGGMWACDEDLNRASQMIWTSTSLGILAPRTTPGRHRSS